MAKDLSEQLSRIGHKAELIVTRFGTLKEENARLQEENASLRAELRSLEKVNEKQRVELEFLKISGSIAPDTATARETRAILSNLVREIDACIADLMKDI